MAGVSFGNLLSMAGGSFDEFLSMYLSLKIDEAPASNNGKDSCNSDKALLAEKQTKTVLASSRRSPLTMATISPHFNISLVKATKKLGVSMTHLKHRMRQLGIQHWPCRQMESLEKAIHAFEHEIAMEGQTTLTKNMIFLYEKLIENRQECLAGDRGALQHLMDSKMLSATYKFLYSSGWRSRGPCQYCGGRIN